MRYYRSLDVRNRADVADALRPTLTTHPIPRLSTIERRLLELLQHDASFGLQLVARSHGTLNRNTIYVMLGRMEDKGYVESWMAPPSPGCKGMRRWYRATPHGIRILTAWALVDQVLAGLPEAHAPSLRL